MTTQRPLVENSLSPFSATSRSASARILSRRLSIAAICRPFSQRPSFASSVGRSRARSRSSAWREKRSELLLGAQVVVDREGAREVHGVDAERGVAQDVADVLGVEC